jgi:hypothetical protein
VKFVGRSRELGLLRQMLDRTEPQLIRLVGPPGVGTSRLVRRAARDFHATVFTCPPLPDPDQRHALAAELPPGTSEHPAPGGPGSREEDVPAAPEEGGAPAWSTLFHRLRASAGRSSRPRVLVVDDAHRLGHARARFVPPLLAALRAASAQGTPLHVVLVGRASDLPAEDALRGGEGRTRNAGAEADRVPAVTTLTLGPLPFRAASELLPRTEPHQLLRAYGVFGGIPRVLSRLDTDRAVGTNVRRLLLAREGALADAPLSWLEREVQSPPRYAAILRSLAHGAADWKHIHEGVPDLTSSGQVAPYLARLAALGLIEATTSLDAGPRSRGTRYALTDPFLAFWFRFVLPWRCAEPGHAEEPPLREHYARTVRPGIDEHMRTVMPMIARQHMAYDALETLGASPREEGALWGSGYDIPVAGILSSGAAYYGTCTWAPHHREDAPLETLDRAVGETRYGFGRERRLRLVFTGRGAPTWLRREVARRRDAELIDARTLLGR